EGALDGALGGLGAVPHHLAEGTARPRVVRAGAFAVLVPHQHACRAQPPDGFGPAPLAGEGSALQAPAYDGHVTIVADRDRAQATGPAVGLESLQHDVPGAGRRIVELTELVVVAAGALAVVARRGRLLPLAHVEVEVACPPSGGDGEASGAGGNGDAIELRAPLIA